MKTTAEMIEVMQAFERGEEIEVLVTGLGGQSAWITAFPPGWNWSNTDYRIKPREPRVIWVNEYKVGNYVEYTVHETREKSLEKAARTVIRIAVKYREVIE